MPYYVHVSTRGSKRRERPRKALAYIVRGQGNTTVPLLGLGVLASVHDERELAARFEEACQPIHHPCATLGYKSIALTLPKELSIFADGHPEEARAAIHAAAQHALDRAFVGLQYMAVAAIHARGRKGQVHYYAHVLVGKFAYRAQTARTVSLNSSKNGNTGAARLRELKVGWREGIDAQFGRAIRPPHRTEFEPRAGFRRASGRHQA